MQFFRAPGEERQEAEQSHGAEDRGNERREPGIADNANEPVRQRETARDKRKGESNSESQPEATSSGGIDKGPFGGPLIESVDQAANRRRVVVRSYAVTRRTSRTSTGTAPGFGRITLVALGFLCFRQG